MSDPQENTEQEELETCPVCEGGGWIAKLYPSGHTEVACERCDGEGTL